MERLLCKNCNTKFFGTAKNKSICPKCHTLYVRKSKKVDTIDFDLEKEEDFEEE